MGARRTVSYEERGKAILAYLKHSGRQMTAQELANMFGLGSKNIARRIVKEMRAKGALICSGYDGYFYSTDEQDINDTVKMLDCMTNGLQATVNNLNSAYTKYKENGFNDSEQLSLF